MTYNVFGGTLSLAQSIKTREAAWYVISVVSVCMSLCRMIAFESLDVGSSY